MPNIGSTGGAVPAGGAQNAVLTKKTATDYDVQWAAASGSGGGGASWTGGRWFNPGANTAIIGQGGWAFANNLCLLPIYVPNACTISQIGLLSTATVTARTALYADSGSGVPSLGPGAMIGTQLSTTLTGSATNSNSYAVTGWTIPSAGIYWWAFSVSAAGGMYSATYNPPFFSTLGLSSGSPYRYTPNYTYASTWPADLSTTLLTTPAASSTAAYNFCWGTFYV